MKRIQNQDSPTIRIQNLKKNVFVCRAMEQSIKYYNLVLITLIYNHDSLYYYCKRWKLNINIWRRFSLT